MIERWEIDFVRLEREYCPEHVHLAGKKFTRLCVFA